MSLPSWDEYGRLILSELKELKKLVGSAEKQTTNCLLRLTKLETRATLFGGIAGFCASLVPVGIEALISYLKTKS